MSSKAELSSDPKRVDGVGLVSAVAIAVSSDSDLRTMLQRCAEKLVGQLGVAFARIWTVRLDSRTLELQASAGMYTHLDGGHSQIPIGELKIGRIAQNNQSHLTNQVIGDSQVHDQEWAAREGMVAFAGYPLSVGGRVIGVMGMFARHPLDPELLPLLAAIADIIAMGIARKRSEHERFELVGRERAATLSLLSELRLNETLFRLAASVSGELDEQKLLQRITDELTTLTGARCGVFFYSKDESGLTHLLHTLAGVDKDLFANLPLPRVTPLFRPTFSGEGTIRLDDVTQDPRYGLWGPQPLGFPVIRSYLAVPVIDHRGQPLGGLLFGHREAAQFTEYHERIVTGVRSYFTIALENARLYRQLKDNEEQIKRAYERVVEADRRKDEFLATLSHELRNPLNSILGWSQILRRRNPDDEKVQQAATVIDRNARLQVQLIGDLLDMSRILSGKLRLDVQRVDPGEIILNALASIEPAAQAKGVRLEKMLDPLAGPMRGDPNRLQQIVWNLLSNAIKFTSRGGRIQILLERVNSHLEIVVSDSGKGIKPEFLPYVFDRFRQADASITRSEGGLGLGLSIVKHLTELHGGSVRAKSPGENQGATFIVELPMLVLHDPDGDQKREHPRAIGQPESSEFVSLKGLSVLVVDDDGDARELIKTLLEEAGAKADLAGSAAEGIRRLKDKRYDVLLSDIGMPERDGYSFIREVRELDAERGGKTPAAALTALARSDDRTRALRAGYQMHVSKPIEPPELIAVVASLAEMIGSSKAD